MAARSPKRIYSPAALESWLTRLEAPWEGHFERPVLDLARQIYREGEIREIEISSADAIIHARREKQTVYSLLEWNNDSPAIRHSTEDQLFGQALGAAGLYEIEELVADEVSPVAPAPKEEKAKPGNGSTSPGELTNGHRQNGHGERNLNGGNGSNGSHMKQSGSGTHLENGKSVPPQTTTESENKSPSSPQEVPLSPSSKRPSSSTESPPAKTKSPDKPKDPAKAKSRRVLLTLDPVAAGLRLRADWSDGTGSPLQKGGPAPSADEREQLVRLGALAKRAGFDFRAKQADYLLRSLDQYPVFLKQELPKWRKAFRLKIDPRVKHLSRGRQEANLQVAVEETKNGLNVTWKARLGEEALPAQAAARLLRRAKHAVLLPDHGIVQLATDDGILLTEWRQFLRESGKGELPRYLLYSLFARTGLPVQLSPELASWRESLEHPPAHDASLPEMLRPYQAQGVSWLKHLRDHHCHPLLADEMGLGKTLQVLTLLQQNPSQNLPAVVVCPASVAPVWEAEARRFFPQLPLQRLKHGNNFAEQSEPALWIASYTQLRRHRSLLDKHPFVHAILDEGQFIKNPDAKITQACLAIRAQHRIVLTGTPLENRQRDLWTLFRFLMPGLLGPRTALERAAQEDPTALDQTLRRQVAPFVLRRTKADVLDELPAKTETALYCPLTQLQESEYRRLVEEGLKDLGDNLSKAVERRAASVFTLLTRLRQVCCDPQLLPWMPGGLEPSGKLRVLRQKLTEAYAHGSKVVVFSQFVTFLRRVRSVHDEHFSHIPLFELTGRTRDRAAPVDGFQKAAGSAIALVSLRAGGTGITLHAADRVFLLDPWWNPAVEAQAMDRVHRIGQKRPVHIYRLLTAGTVEDRVERLKEQKRTLFDNVIGGIGQVGRLTEDFRSLRDLIQREEEV